MAMDDLVFLELEELEAIHTDQLEKFGGQDGYIDKPAVDVRTRLRRGPERC